jgi:hypothetical protein
MYEYKIASCYTLFSIVFVMVIKYQIILWLKYTKMGYVDVY